MFILRRVPSKVWDDYKLELVSYRNSTSQKDPHYERDESSFYCHFLSNSSAEEFTWLFADSVFEDYENIDYFYIRLFSTEGKELLSLYGVRKSENETAIVKW